MADGQEQQKQEPRALEQKRMTMPVPMRAGVLAPTTLAEAVEVAKYIAHSSMVPEGFRGQVGDVLIAMQMGAELGLSPMSSLQNIAVINGRPSLWGDAVLALVVARQDCEDVVEALDEKTMTATCTVKRRDRAPTIRTFSKADAETAQLWGKKGPWTNYPKRMLQLRARGFALRDAFPDALRGIGVAEEEGDKAITMRAEFADVRDHDEPVEGVHRVGEAKRAAPAAETEPPHDPKTGEVVTAAEPAQTAAAKPAANGKLF